MPASPAPVTTSAAAPAAFAALTLGARADGASAAGVASPALIGASVGTVTADAMSLIGTAGVGTVNAGGVAPVTPNAVQAPAIRLASSAGTARAAPAAAPVASGHGMVAQGTVAPMVGMPPVAASAVAVSAPARPEVSAFGNDNQTEAEPVSDVADVAAQPASSMTATTVPVAAVVKVPPAAKGSAPAPAVRGRGSDQDHATAAAPMPAVSAAAVSTRAAVAISAQAVTAASAGSPAPVPGDSAKAAVTGGPAMHGDAQVHIPEAIPEASASAAQPAENAPAASSVQTEAEVPVIQVKVQRQDDQTSSAPAETVTVADAGGSPIQSARAAPSDPSTTARNNDSQGAAEAPAQDTGPVSDPGTSDPGAAAVVSAAQALPVAQGTADPVTTAAGMAAPGTAVPVTTPPMPELASTAAAHVSAAGQIGPALLTLGTAADGTQQMTLRLQPEEMGTVQVRIDRAPDGTSQVNITADNPSTLRLLTSEQSDLHKALDAAGISAAGRTVTFGLTPEGTAAFTGSANGSAGGSGNPVEMAANRAREDTSAGQQSMGGGAMSQGSSGGASGGSSGTARQDGEGGRSVYQPVFEVTAGTLSESMDPDTDISD